MIKFFRLVAVMMYTMVVLLAVALSIVAFVIQPKAKADVGTPAACVLHFIMNGHMHVAYVTGNLVQEYENVYIVDISNAADTLQLKEKWNHGARAFAKDDCEIGKSRPNHTKDEVDYYDSLPNTHHYADAFDELTEAGLQ